MSKKIYVKKWISWDGSSELDTVHGELKSGNKYYDALKEEFYGTGMKYSGEYHQHSGKGVPLFSDGTVCRRSYRAWGAIMARIWTELDEVNYKYMDFYMPSRSEGVL